MISCRGRFCQPVLTRRDPGRERGEGRKRKKTTPEKDSGVVVEFHERVVPESFWLTLTDLSRATRTDQPEGCVSRAAESEACPNATGSKPWDSRAAPWGQPSSEQQERLAWEPHRSHRHHNHWCNRYRSSYHSCLPPLRNHTLPGLLQPADGQTGRSHPEHMSGRQRLPCCSSKRSYVSDHRSRQPLLPELAHLHHSGHRRRQP